MALLRCKSCGKSTMYNITITDRADRELSDILEYLSVQLQNPTAATAFVEEVLSVYEALKHTPYICLNSPTISGCIVWGITRL